MTRYGVLSVLDNAYQTRQYGGMTVEDLRRIQSMLDKSARKTQMLRDCRDAVVRDSIEEGMSHSEIAEATGLSRGRIGQIATALLPFKVVFQNPAAGVVERYFATRDEAEDRVAHYREKYETFPGYIEAAVEENDDV